MGGFVREAGLKGAGGNRDRGRMCVTVRGALGCMGVLIRKPGLLREARSTTVDGEERIR